MTQPAEPGTGLPRDEAAFYQAWMGALWSRYRPLFEDFEGARRFEWRAALYPLWLLVPGLYLQLAAFLVLVTVVLAAVLEASPDSSADIISLVLVLAAAVGFWPVMVVLTIVLAATAGSIGVEIALAPLMVALSAALGLLTPRWVVAEGRRRWRSNVERAASGRAPPPPKAITGWRPLRTLALLLVVGVPAWILLVPDHRHDPGMYYRAALRSDLRNLLTAQEVFFADSQRYAASLDAAVFTPSTGVSVRIVELSDSAWSAIATHAASRYRCGIFVGAVAPPVEGATRGGEPFCVLEER